MVNNISVEEIKIFLVSIGWEEDSEQSGERFYRLKPPEASTLSDEYRLVLNRRVSGDLSYIETILSVITKVENITVEELVSIISERRPVFSIRISDEDTETLGLQSFDKLLSRTSKLIRNAAAFVLSGEPKLEKISPQADYFLSQCDFLRTEKGSFISKILLPSQQTIRPLGLFTDQVDALEISERLIEILEFTSRVVNSNSELHNQIQTNRNLVNLDVLEDIRDLYLKVGIQNTDFTLISPTGISSAKLLDMNSRRVNRLTDFINIIREELRDEEISVTISRGQVTTLKSQNPFENENRVGIFGMEENTNQAILLIVELPSDLYLEALNAHAQHHLVEISGIAVKRAQDYKLIERTSFSVLSEAITEE